MQGGLCCVVVPSYIGPTKSEYLLLLRQCVLEYNNHINHNIQTNHNYNSITKNKMVDSSDDSDEELGAYIYSISHTAQLFREEAAAAAARTRNNELSTNNDTNITRTKRKSPHEVENNTSVLSEPKQRTKKKWKKKTCSQEGCTNQVKNGGVCIRHGASWKKYTCSNEGCVNQVKNGGVCISHGASRTIKICTNERCNNQVRKGGVCIRHGAKRTQKRKNCSREGCTNKTRKGGVCIRHGAKVTCSYEGCTNYVQIGGVCYRHGALNLYL